jgi:hypothetical protein
VVCTAYLALQSEGGRSSTFRIRRRITTSAASAPATCPNGFRHGGLRRRRRVRGNVLRALRVGRPLRRDRSTLDPPLRSCSTLRLAGVAEAVDVETFAGGEAVIGYVADHTAA